MICSILTHTHTHNHTHTHTHTSNPSPVISVAWAPHEYGLILVCGSSDGAVSVLTYTASNYQVRKLIDIFTLTFLKEAKMNILWIRSRNRTYRVVRRLVP